MHPNNKYTNSGVTAYSYRSESIDELPIADYDLLIISSSWDSRCKNITTLKKPHISTCILILFEECSDKKTEHGKGLEQWAKSIVKETFIINGKLTDAELLYEQLFTKIINLYISLNRPVKILFDYSTCPVFIPLSILSKGFDLGIIKQIDYLYGECTYPEKENGRIIDREILFTSGEWVTMEVDSLLGNYEPSKKNQLSVSIGFEGNKTLRVINKEDPDSLIILIPAPGFDDSYIDRVKSANSELFRAEGITEDETVNAAAGDAVEAWKKLHEKLSPMSSKFNQKLLCAGTKPHSLGMTLLGITNKDVAVLYSKPQEHKHVEIVPKNTFWLYSILSLTAPL